MDIWEACNSLRYGFDDEYDSPFFEDEEEDESEEV
jgi:hypothetical protein|tara:strand:+ start:253 stop:357 length:105 start_codon:yes stop_codon:yes gene_type:complete